MGGGQGYGQPGAQQKDMVYRDIDPSTFAPGTAPGTSGPASISRTPGTYSSNPYGQYTTPTFGMTPQYGYAGLSQQISQAANTPFSMFAPPRTGLMDMYASPWSMLYGGPAQPTFGDYWGQDPMQSRTSPPPGTPGFIGNPPPPTQPPPNQPPPNQPPPPPNQPPTSVPSAPYTPPPGTAPPAGGTVPAGRNKAGEWGNRGGFKKQYGLPSLAELRKYHGGPPGADPTGGSPPGTFMNDFAAAGGDVGRYGAAAALMATRTGNQGLTNAQIIEQMRNRQRIPDGPGRIPTTPIDFFRKP